MPSLSITPGRKFSITTSTFGTMPLDHLDRLGLLEVHGDRALAAVDRDPGRGEPALLPVVGAVAEAHVVAFARFDLDDVGAEQRELVGGVGPREDTREVEDLHAGERLAHGTWIPASLGVTCRFGHATPAFLRCSSAVCLTLSNSARRLATSSAGMRARLL